MEPLYSTQNNRTLLPAIIWILIGVAIIGSGLYYLLQEDLTTIPKEQLEAIKAGQESDAYYKYTTKEFQESTSLNAFHTFLELHPIFRKNLIPHLNVVEKKSDQATLKGNLSTQDGSSLAIEYKLIKEDGKWKIETLTLLDVGPRNNLKESDTVAEIQKPINDQLKALSEHNIHKAYYKLVSEEFQHSTSFKDFEKFVAENPILIQNTRKEVVNSDIDGNEARVTVKLYQGATDTPIEYALKRSKGEWKIWSLRLIVPQQAEASNSPANSRDLATIFEASIAPLRDNNLAKTYYQHTTRTFRSQQPLEKFRGFVNSHIAIKNGLPEYYQGFIGNDTAVFKVHFQDNDKPVLVRVTMKKEGEQWKIDSIDPLNAPSPIWAANKPHDDHELIAQLDTHETTSLQHAPASKKPETPITQSSNILVSGAEQQQNIIQVVDDQLKNLRTGNTANSYNAYMAKGFRDVNSYETYLNFIRAYPILTTVTPQIKLVSNQNGMASVSAEMSTPGGVTQVNYLMVLENNAWKILGIDITIPKILSMPIEKKDALPPDAPDVSIDKYEANPNDLLTPVKQLLISLSHTDFSAAYKYYMSNGFQKATSYADFKKVMQRIPGITQGTPKFDKPRIENNIGYVTATYSGPYGSSRLDFTLIRENKSWRIHILNISGTTSPIETQTGTPVTEQPNPLPPENLNASSLEYPIQKQIYLSTLGDINRAYFELTSQSFQRSTNLQEFNDFIQGYAVFTQNADYKIENQETGSNTASLKVYLTSRSGEKATVIYDLIKENNLWKILNIQLVDASAPPKGIAKQEVHTAKKGAANSPPTPPQGPIRLAPRSGAEEPASGPTGGQFIPKTASGNGDKLTFNYGAFGTSVNEEGLIKQPSLNIPKGKTNIYFNLSIDNAKKGDQVSLNFKHLKSGTTIPEIRSMVNHDGSSTLSFIFAPPPDGWPEGVYEVTVSANNGATQTYTFRVP